MDTLLSSFPAPDFVKMDVEGAELLALQGATKLVRDIRPIFYVEVGSDVADEILKLFSSHAYVALDEQGQVLQDKCTNNTFFIPKESDKLRG
ncbi:FkbM family methyltransferase [Arenicella chitinivorans]